MFHFLFQGSIFIVLFFCFPLWGIWERLNEQQANQKHKKELLLPPKFLCNTFYGAYTHLRVIPIQLLFLIHFKPLRMMDDSDFVNYILSGSFLVWNRQKKAQNKTVNVAMKCKKCFFLEKTRFKMLH